MTDDTFNPSTDLPLAQNELSDVFGQPRYTTGAIDTTWGANDVTKRRYINQEDLTDAHLIDLNARIYDPLLGKFLSPDPVIKDQDDSQAWNAYAYSHNNPMSKEDPTGLWYVEGKLPSESGSVNGFDLTATLGNVGSVGPGVVTQYVYFNGRSFQNISVGEALHLSDNPNVHYSHAAATVLLHVLDQMEAALQANGANSGAGSTGAPATGTTLELHFRSVFHTAFDHGEIIATNNATGAQIVTQAGPFGPPCAGCGVFGLTTASTDPYGPGSAGYGESFALGASFSTKESPSQVRADLENFSAAYNARQVPYFLWTQNSSTFAAAAWKSMTGYVPTLPRGVIAPAWPTSSFGGW